MGHAGAEHYMIPELFRMLQLVQRRDVDNQVGLHQPQVQHGPKRLTTGQHFGMRVLIGQQADRIVKMPRTLIGKINRLHGRDPAGTAALARRNLAAAMDSRTRRGVIGEYNSSAPNPLSASLTALAIAAGGAIEAPSAMA